MLLLVWLQAAKQPPSHQYPPKKLECEGPSRSQVLPNDGYVRDGLFDDHLTTLVKAAKEYVDPPSKVTTQAKHGQLWHCTQQVLPMSLLCNEFTAMIFTMPT